MSFGMRGAPHDGRKQARPVDRIGDAQPDEERASADVRVRNASAFAVPPHARIVAVVPVVAHDVDLARLHRERPLILREHAAAIVEREERLVAEVLDEQLAFVLHGRKPRGHRLGVFVAELPDEAARHFPSVDPRVAVLRLELVAGEGDDPLDEVLRRLLGEREDHDVAAIGRHRRPQALLGVRNRRAVAEFVHEDVIADHERRDHRAARDLERLDDERAEAERDERRHGDRFDVLAQLALAPASETLVDRDVGAAERVGERLGFERLPIHRRAKDDEVLAQIAPLFGGEIADDRFRVLLENELGFVEEAACPLERAVGIARHVGPNGRVRVRREGQMVARGPERHLEEREHDDPHRHRLFADDAFEPSEDVAAEVAPARRRERPDEEARQDDRHRDEPDRPVHEAQQARPRRERRRGGLFGGGCFGDGARGVVAVGVSGRQRGGRSDGVCLIGQEPPPIWIK